MLLMKFLSKNRLLSASKKLVVLIIIMIIVVITKYSKYFTNLPSSKLDIFPERKLRHKNALRPCLKKSRKLVGFIPVNKTKISWRELEKKYKKTLSKGHYKPNCQSQTSAAIIIPYRKREHHIKIFMNNLHSFLQRQLIEYGIYVIEQSEKHDFNRAMLMNIGFVESNKMHKYNCFIFHDADLIPENDNNIYDCKQSPRHMSVAVSKFKYKLPYKNLFGGIVSFRKEDFLKINGFSNRFFGWGSEDDDLFRRVLQHKLIIHRRSANIARYTMLSHSKAKTNENRFAVLNDSQHEKDGINSLRYTVTSTLIKRLYINIKVNLMKDF